MSTVRSAAQGTPAAILERIQPGGLLIGIDQGHADAIQNAASQVLKAYESSNVRLIHDNYVNLPNILSQLEHLQGRWNHCRSRPVL